MNTAMPNLEKLQDENAELRARLAEVEETLRAICEGEVDAVVVSGSKGDRVYALSETENLHRLMVETMTEAALATSTNGTLVFCNDRACTLLGRPKDQLLGKDIGRLVSAADIDRFRQLLMAATTARADARIEFVTEAGTRVPMHIWANHLDRPDGPLLCLVATDIRRIEADRSSIARLQVQQQDLRGDRAAALNLMEDALASRQEAEKAVAALKVSEEALRRAHDGLEERVRERTAQWMEANENLQQALDFKNDLYHHAPCGYHSADASGLLLEINDTALQWLGFTREELVGIKTVFDLQTPESRKRGRKSFLQLKHGQAVHDLQLDLLRKDGSTLSVLLNATPVLDTAGRLIRTRSAFVDVTDRVKTEQALARSEARLQAILDFSPAVIFLKDLQGRYLVVNHEFERVFRMHRSKVLGRTDLELFPRKQASSYRANDRAVLRARHPLAFEEFAGGRDGRYISVVVKFPLRDSVGKIHALGGIAIDITARKRAESLLQTSEAKFRGFVESAPDAVVIMSRRGRIQLVNAQTERMFGYERSELLNRHFRRLIPARLRRLRTSQEALRVGTPRSQPADPGLALYGRRKDGEEFPVEISLSPLNSESGPLVCAAIRDVTTRKRIEDDLRKSKLHYLALFKEAQAARRSLQRLSSLVLEAQEKERKRISRELHDDVGQVLTAINITLQGIHLNGSQDVLAVQRRFDDVLRLLDGAMTTVHDFARELRPSLLDELGLLPAIRSSLQGLAERSGLHVELRGDPRVEHLQNEEKLVLFRVTQESLNNVVKHAQARRVRVSLSQAAHGVVLTITDDGKSFDPKRNGATTRQRLGLLGMRERVRLVDGEFSIQAKPGKGTTVRVSIPIRPGTPLAAEQARSRRG